MPDQFKRSGRSQACTVHKRQAFLSEQAISRYVFALNAHRRTPRPRAPTQHFLSRGRDSPTVHQIPLRAPATGGRWFTNFVRVDQGSELV